MKLRSLVSSATVQLQLDHWAMLPHVRVGDGDFSLGKWSGWRAEPAQGSGFFFAGMSLSVVLITARSPPTQSARRAGNTVRSTVPATQPRP